MPVAAEPRDVDVVIARRCGNEAAGRARCVRDLADARIAGIEEMIAESTSGLQSVPARALRRLEADLRAQQRAWRAEVADVCGAQERPMARQRCRLAAALEREDEVRDTLEGVRDLSRADQQAEFELPEYGTIHVPVPSPSGGPDLDLELEVPLFPQ